ncbi:PH and SEC7 domain-containing protein [Sporobolomyces salmoneus]|uniref:PH and SEC7 domain-containing protein n=1 Tax=Sporobolomyces salmoneus TaxID=183962 RepID=UPI0031829083
MLSPNARTRSHSPRFDPPSSSSNSLSSSSHSHDPSNSRAQKRLSRISPSEFDSLLSSSSTIHTKIVDESTLGSTPSSYSPSHSPEREREREPPITPQKGGGDDESFKRRSMFRSVGNASSPDLASLIRKAREQRQLLSSQTEDYAGQEEEEEDAEEERGGLSYNVESPTKPSPRRSNSPSPRSPIVVTTTTGTRSRSTTSPEISLSEFAAQSSSSPSLSSSTQTQSQQRIFNSPSPNASISRQQRERESTQLSNESTTTTSSNLGASSGFILVPPPPPPPVQASNALPSRSSSPPRSVTSTVQALKSQRQGDNLSTTMMRNQNQSSTSLISTFDSNSPRRKRGNTTTEGDRDRQEEGAGGGRLSLGNTMRKTSRFFKKFGASSNNPVPSNPTPRTQQPSTSTNSTTTTTSNQFPPSVPLPPPVPPIPSTYVSPPRPTTTQPLTSSSSNPTGTPTRASASSKVESPSLSPSQGSSSPRGIRRKRSLSVPQRRSQDSTSQNSDGGRSGSGGGSAEGDRLRNELRLWRLGVDGVLGGTSIDSTGERRPSLPDSTLTPRTQQGEEESGELEGIKMTRGGSAPLEGRGRTMMPSIKLSSPKRTTNPSLPPATSSPRKHSTTDEGSLEGGGGLGSIPETSHSRENSAATINSSSPSPLLSNGSSTFPLPMSPPMIPTPSTTSSSSAASTVRSRTPKNNNLNSRISIVGYPVPSSSSSSSSSVPSPTPSLPRYLTSPGSSTTMSMSKNSSSSSSLPLTIGAMTSPSQISTTSTIRGNHSPSLSPSPSPSTLDGGEDVLEEKAKEFAMKCWNEDEGFLERKKIAEWLGSSHDLNRRTLKHYIEKFDFHGLRLDLAFRRLCGKLYLKAETQQVDRILEQFSSKFYRDNPKSPYSSADVVHAVSYSMLLLNTDLHVVDSTTRMTRQQFVRNTLNAIQSQTGNVVEDSVEVSSVFSPTLSEVDGDASRRSSERPRTSASGTGGKRPLTGEGGRESPLNGSPNQSRTNLGSSDSPLRGAAGGGTGLGLSQRSESVMTVGSVSSNKSLEANLQIVLKDMYNAIRSQPIYQSSSSSASASTLNLPLDDSRPSLALSPHSSSGNSPYSTWSSGINRTASRRSGHSTSTTTHGSNSKRSSVRGFGALLGTSGMSANNSSLDLVRSTSPTPSNSTSLSDEHWSTSGFHHTVPTIGFANSLSHTIIREHEESGADARSILSTSSTISVSDQELALLGAPWAKEGMLQRKHYWEVQGKRSKEKNWLKAFVVVSQGELRMFRFDGGGSSSSGRSGGGMGMGGGDWTSNASNVGSISLIHALCSAMPPPGYSRDRPHCFVLTLPSGGTYFFQAGTPDLVSEWVSTCNYWSARLSREPLSGGVSNVEYGWNKVEARFGEGDAEDRDRDEEKMSIKSGKSGHSRMSYAASTFNASTISGGGGGNSNDRMRIEDWKPPNVPLTPSQLGEEAQLEHLKKHVRIVQGELEHHNELRGPMVKLYSSRSSNYAKAVANWERKSQHLLSEIVKWSTYIEALTSGVRLRSIQRGKKEVEAMLKSADLDDEAEEEEEDDDELARRLSPFDEAPSSSTTKLTPTTTTTTTILPSEGIKRLQLEGERPKSARSSTDRPPGSISRVSVTTTSTRGGVDEFFDTNDMTPPAAS